MIDEINCCLSLTLEKGIVEYFSKTEDTKGQLIFTTHEEQRIHERRVTYTNANINHDSRNLLCCQYIKDPSAGTLQDGDAVCHQ